MSVVVETTLGDITVDLYLKTRPKACLNFLKLCKLKYYNYNLFHTVSRGFIAQTGDPTGSRKGGESIFGVLEGTDKRFFEPEVTPRIKHTIMGLISFVGNEERMIGSQFFFTLGTDLTYLDDKHCVFGEVVEGMDVIELINEAICDNDDRPYQDIRITHTVILDDPFPDPKRLQVPSRSPSPSAERLQGGRIAPDEEIDETAGKTAEEISEMLAEREAKARATILEMVGDIPDAEMAPPENVLFVCKLNPVTSDDDLEIIFSRFGKIKSCEVIRDKKTGDSLQYAFVEFEDQKSCEDAYFKMDNVLIDDRRIHVDFSQSVAKVKWLGKGRGVKTYGQKGQDIGKGNYQRNTSDKKKNDKPDKHYDTWKKDDRDRHNRNDNNRRDERYDRRRNDERSDNRRRRSRSEERDRYYRPDRRNGRDVRRYNDERENNRQELKRRYDEEPHKKRQNNQDRNTNEERDKQKYKNKKHKSKRKSSEDSDSSDDEETRKKSSKKRNKKKSKRSSSSSSETSDSSSSSSTSSSEEEESRKDKDRKKKSKHDSDRRQEYDNRKYKEDRSDKGRRKVRRSRSEESDERRNNRKEDRRRSRSNERRNYYAEKQKMKYKDEKRRHRHRSRS